MNSPSPELARCIQRLIEQLDVAHPGAWPQRECKEKHNALPLAGNSIYLWALRPDGAIVCVDHEAYGLPSEIERDPVVIYGVMVQGADLYPELLPLVPVQPADARRCGTCGGTGMDEYAGRRVSCLGCSGLGWYREGGW